MATKNVAQKKAGKALAAQSKTVYLSKATGKEVTPTYAKANPARVIKKRVKVAPAKSARKTVAKKVLAKKAPAKRVTQTVVGTMPLSSRQYLDGLESKATYLVIAKQGADKKAAIRWINDDQIRVHLFPNVEAIFSQAPGTWYYRSNKGYSTRWMDRSEFDSLYSALTQLKGYQVMAMSQILEGSRMLKGKAGNTLAAVA